MKGEDFRVDERTRHGKFKLYISVKIATKRRLKEMLKPGQTLDELINELIDSRINLARPMDNVLWDY